MEQFFIDFASAISPALQTLLEAVLTLIAAQVSAWLFKQYQNQRAQLDAQQQWAVDFVVTQAVRAAQQLYKDKQGKEKKAYAFSVAENELAKRGLAIDLDILNTKIEAAVYSNFKAPVTPAG